MQGQGQKNFHESKAALICTANEYSKIAAIAFPKDRRNFADDAPPFSAVNFELLWASSLEGSTPALRTSSASSSISRGWIGFFGLDVFGVKGLSVGGILEVLAVASVLEAALQRSVSQQSIETSPEPT